jgi:hypothetical protein
VLRCLMQQSRLVLILSHRVDAVLIKKQHDIRVLTYVVCLRRLMQRSRPVLVLGCYIGTALDE